MRGRNIGLTACRPHGVAERGATRVGEGLRSCRGNEEDYTEHRPTRVVSQGPW